MKAGSERRVAADSVGDGSRRAVEGVITGLTVNRQGCYRSRTRQRGLGTAFGAGSPGGMWRRRRIGV